MAFNQKFIQGATISQIRNALNYSAFLITPEQEQDLKADKLIEVKTEDASTLANEIVYPAGAVNVTHEVLPLRRFTGTNLYE